MSTNIHQWDLGLHVIYKELEYEHEDEHEDEFEDEFEDNPTKP